jgi:hypothetical protein
MKFSEITIFDGATISFHLKYIPEVAQSYYVVGERVVMIRLQILAITSCLTAYAAPALADCLEDANKFAVNLCGDIERSGIRKLRAEA